MYILSINPGSTSIKYSLFKGNSEVFFGHFSARGGSASGGKKTKNRYSFNSKKIQKKDFENSIDYLVDLLKAKKQIKSLRDISKIGIRIVHGGNFFKKTTLINQKNLKKLRKISPLAPLHNPSAIQIIGQIQKKYPKTKIYGIFDTAFHQTIPDIASIYPIPRALSENLHIKKYGFHGIACQWNLHQIKKSLKKIPENIIICHLGGGCSITAVKDGKSVDTSMGFTPLEGLIMITRTGDLDNGVVGYLAKTLNLKTSDVIDILNNKSGIFGITKLKDMKKVVDRAERNDKWCKLAVEMFVYRIVKYIYAYYGVLQGLDLLIFSGGIGEGSCLIRKKICEKLKMLGFKIDPKKNRETVYKTEKISSQNSKDLFVVHVEENKEILRQILDSNFI